MLQRKNKKIIGILQVLLFFFDPFLVLGTK